MNNEDKLRKALLDFMCCSEGELDQMRAAVEAQPVCENRTLAMNAIRVLIETRPIGHHGGAE